MKDKRQNQQQEFVHLRNFSPSTQFLLKYSKNFFSSANLQKKYMDCIVHIIIGTVFHDESYIIEDLIRFFWIASQIVHIFSTPLYMLNTQDHTTPCDLSTIFSAFKCQILRKNARYIVA